MDVTALAMRSRRAAGGSYHETLADALNELSLAESIRYVGQVARLLQQLHEQNEVHGDLTAAHVRLKGTSVELVPAQTLREVGSPESDLRALGAVLYEAATGSAVPKNASGDMFHPAIEGRPATVREEAVRLAGKCLGHGATSLTMRKAATEAQVLWLQARQEESGIGMKAPAVPFLVTPAEQSSTTPEDPAGPTGVSTDERRVNMETEAVKQKADAIPAEGTSKREAIHPAGMECPKCGSTSVSATTARTAFERTVSDSGIPIRECGQCKYRYMVVGGAPVSKEIPPPPEQGCGHLARRYIYQGEL